MHHMQSWVSGGPPPPVQPRIEFAGDPPEVVRDEHRIARGGIRLPQVDVPVAHNGAITDAASGYGFLAGSHEPFPPEEVRALVRRSRRPTWPGSRRRHVPRRRPASSCPATSTGCSTDAACGVPARADADPLATARAVGTIAALPVASPRRSLRLRGRPCAAHSRGASSPRSSSPSSSPCPSTSRAPTSPPLPTRPGRQRLGAPGRRPARARVPGARRRCTAPVTAGVDFAAPPGTPVRAANGGEVAFAGSVAGTLHVTIAHAGGLRTTLLVPRDRHRARRRHGRARRRDRHHGRRDGDGDGDGAARRRVLHFALRLGDRYLDPMLLFRPRRSHQGGAPRAGRAARRSARGRRPTSAASSRSRCSSRSPGGVPAPERRRRRLRHGRAPGGRRARRARATSPTWLGDTAHDAVDGGIAALHAMTGIATDILGTLRAPVHLTIEALRALPAAIARGLARTPAGHPRARPRRHGPALRRHAHRGVQRRRTRRRRHGRLRAPRDGGGGHQQRRAARGPRPDRRPRRLRARLPPRRGRGPLVLLRRRRWCLHRGRHARADRRRRRSGSPRSSARCSASSPAARSTWSRTPRVGWWSTCSSPGTTTRPTAASRRSAPSSRSPPRTRARRSPRRPSASAACPAASRCSTSCRGSHRRTARRSATSRSARPPSTRCSDGGCPSTSTSRRSARPRTPWCPPPTSRCRGARETVVAVTAANEHSAVLADTDGLRAIRAGLEGRPPPCVGLDTALRSAVAPVVISRLEHGPF